MINQAAALENSLLGGAATYFFYKTEHPYSRYAARVYSKLLREVSVRSTDKMMSLGDLYQYMHSIALQYDPLIKHYDVNINAQQYLSK